MNRKEDGRSQWMLALLLIAIMVGWAALRLFGREELVLRVLAVPVGFALWLAMRVPWSSWRSPASLATLRHALLSLLGPGAFLAWRLLGGAGTEWTPGEDVVVAGILGFGTFVFLSLPGRRRR